MTAVVRKLCCVGLALAGVAAMIDAVPAGAVTAEVSATLRAGIPNAAYVDRFTPNARAAAAQSELHLAKIPRLGVAVSLTPNQPYAPDGTALNVWKPSFVLGTAAGGEIGLNFWGLHTDGHINLAFTPHTLKTRLLDCRMLSAGPVTYKIYELGAATPAVEAPVGLVEHHLLLAIPVTVADKAVLVEMWPTPTTEGLGFFGCDLSEMD